MDTIAIQVKVVCNMETAKPQEVVNLSASEDEAQNDSVCIKVGESMLHKEDRVVLSNNEWLTDNIYMQLNSVLNKVILIYLAFKTQFFRKQIPLMCKET